MSIVSLSSIGQNPSNFFNQFPEQINLPPHSEVCCLGYSGVQAASQSAAFGGTGQATTIVIKKDINDSFVVYHGAVADGTVDDEFQNAPFAVKLTPGTYSLLAGGANSFAAHLQQALNDADTNQEFYFPNTGGAINGWGVTYNGSGNGEFTIKAIQGRNRRTEPGEWATYMNGGGGVITSPALASGSTTLNPHGAGGAPDNRFFINQREAFLGSQGNVPPMGFTMSIDITPTTTYADLGVAFGYSVEAGISMWKPTDYKAEMWTAATPNKVNIQRNNEVNPNEFTDWAFPESNVPWLQLGMIINPENGRVGIIQCNQENNDGDGKLKQAVNQDVDYDDGEIVTLGGTITIRMCMGMAFDTSDDTYSMEFYFDDGGGTLVLMQTLSLGSPAENFHNPGLLSAGHLFNCVCWEKDHFNANSVSVDMVTQNKSTCDAGGFAQPEVPITIIWRPLTPDMVGVPKRLMQVCGDFSIEHCNGLGLELGFENVFATTATATTPGWESDAKPLAIPVSPLIITCPSLPVSGYIGSGGGGGMQAPILAVCGLRNQISATGFTGAPTSTNWLKLNNEYSLRLDRLNIKLVDETNRQYVGLAGSFSTWLMFRCASKEKTDYALKSVGGTSTNY